MPSLYSQAVFALLGLLPLVGAQGGVFVLNCDPLLYQRSDPIVSPGEVSGHTHLVIGGDAFNRTMSNSLATTASSTTCSVALDKSNYWQPLLYHMLPNGSFEAVQFLGTAAYYLQRACDYVEGEQYCAPDAVPQPPPAGLRMLVGNPFLRNYTDTFAQRAVSHMCLTAPTGVSVQTQSLPTQSCWELRAQTFFPSCWDGVNLDSSDHSSHMAFPEVGNYDGGVCPETHPVSIFSIFLEFYYNTNPYPDYENIVYAMGDPTGYGLHADFVNGWQNLEELAGAFDTCQGAGTDLSLNSAGCSITGGAVQGPQMVTPKFSVPYEDVGLTDAIPALPGSNPITGSAADRIV